MIKVKMTYTSKLPKQVTTNEATRKALEAARNEKERIAAREMEAGMLRGIKKTVSVNLKKNVGRPGHSKAVHR